MNNGSQVHRCTGAWVPVHRFMVLGFKVRVPGSGSRVRATGFTGSADGFTGWSRGERVLVDLDARTALIKVDGNDVEPARRLQQAMARQIVARHPHNTPLLPHRYRGTRPAKRNVPPRLDLDEHDRLPLTRNDVDLAISRAVTTGKNCAITPAT